MEENDLTTSISEKIALRKQKQMERKEKLAESGGTGNKLMIERDQCGLYWVRWNGGGPVPDVLAGKFTALNTVHNLIKTRYGSLDVVFKE